MKKTQNFVTRVGPIEVVKDVPTEMFSRSSMNKLENFLLQPERYATGSEKAIQKVRDINAYFESIKGSLTREKQTEFYRSLDLYENKLKGLKGASR